MLKKLTTLAATSVVALASANAASFTIYTDRAAFEAAAGKLSLEDFNDGTVDAPLSVVSVAGSVANDQWEDRLNDPNDITTWSFDKAITAFGGEWDLAGPGGEGSNIEVTVNFAGGGSQLLSTEIPSSTAGTFVGFTSDMAIVSVVLSEGTNPNGLAETYSLDNLTTSAVPVPAAAPLMLAGLAGMAWKRRRQAK